LARPERAGRNGNVRSGPTWRRLGILLLAGLLLAPPLEVAVMRFANPPATPLMGVRWLEERLGGRRPSPILYSWSNWRELPVSFLKAAWVSEDQRFFHHHGFDWVEMHHAIEKARATGGDPRGSSTISMQCARSLFLWQGHSYVRKALEAYYTVWMETLLSKRRIFELYANVVELGRGVYGVEAASRYYYGVPARRLTGEQAAMLAALLPAPRRWDPRQPSKRLLARQQRILRELPEARWPYP
jgi:monofunctional biosynthetic peptidoglycan transglycosylase